MPAPAQAASREHASPARYLPEQPRSGIPAVGDLVLALATSIMPHGVRERGEVFIATERDVREAGNAMRTLSDEERDEYRARMKARGLPMPTVPTADRSMQGKQARNR